MRAARFTLALIVVVAGTAQLSAHRRDELLQAARLAVEPRRVELYVDLTPGIEVADSIIGDIDRDRDGALSSGEQRAYVESVLGALDLRADGRTLQVDAVAATFPDLDALRGGVGTIRLRTAARLPGLPVGTHELAFGNRHRPEVSVYLANALVPAGDAVEITAQRRDTEQRTLTIEYVVRNQRGAAPLAWAVSVMGAMLLVARKV